MRAPLLACLVVLVTSAVALQNGLARTPQMGWNSWNHFACTINETIMRATADSFISRGLAAAGYNFVNVDDCWAYSRNSNGVIQADPQTFPSGMAALASYVHSKGLKFGLYSDAGNMTCAKRPGSLGYETIDANTYAGWGVDYLKYDNCFASTPPETRYPVMRDALNATGRPIFFSMCEWGQNNPATWAPVVGNSWRTTSDIKDIWISVMANLYANDQWAKYAAPGGWNDPDMLEVGNGGLSATEELSHFSLWCLIKAPLLIGCDITTADNDTIALLTNSEAIAVSQDTLGVQGSRRNVTGSTEVWVAPMSDGSVAAVLFNTGLFKADITAQWATLGWSSTTKISVRDINNHANLGTFSGSYTAKDIPGHGVAFLRFYPQSN